MNNCKSHWTWKNLQNWHWLQDSWKQDLWLTTASIRHVDSYTQQHGSTKSQYINLYLWFEKKWFDTKFMFNTCSSEWFEKKSCITQYHRTLLASIEWSISTTHHSYMLLHYMLWQKQSALATGIQCGNFLRTTRKHPQPKSTGGLEYFVIEKPQ